MNAGNLDRRWKVLAKTTTTNSFGEEVETWAVDTTVWGSWEPMKGNEKWAAQQVVERAEARVRMRYNTAVTALSRLKSDELGDFEVIGEPEQRRRDGETVCNVSRIVGS